MPTAADSSTMPQVISCEARSPRARRPNNPTMAAPKSGGNTAKAFNMVRSALHFIDVFNRDRTAVAEIDHQARQADRRFRRCDGQHEHDEDLTEQVAQEGGEGDEIDADRQQDQFDRHQDDDDVLPVQEDAHDADDEDQRTDDQVIPNADHWTGAPAPEETCLTARTSPRLRPIWAEMRWRWTPGRCLSVSTIAPIIATSRIRPETWKTYR